MPKLAGFCNLLRGSRVTVAVSYTLRVHVVDICVEVSPFLCVTELLCLIFVQIILRYDILLIQEIRDKEEKAIEILLDAVNTAAG